MNAQTAARTAGLHSTSAKFPRAKSEPPMYDALPANADGRITIIYGPHGTHRATTFDPSFAELAVRACNAHDNLVAALRELHDDIRDRVADGARFNPGTLTALDRARARKGWCAVA